jgi:hypothetical protein
MVLRVPFRLNYRDRFCEVSHVVARPGGNTTGTAITHKYSGANGFRVALRANDDPRCSVPTKVSWRTGIWYIWEVNMRKADPNNDDLLFVDLDADVRTRELMSLQHELKTPLTQERLAAWVGQSIQRRALVAGTVWGTIRWEKSLGRPIGAYLADGFTVAHRYYFWTLVVDQGGLVKQVGKWEQLPPPSLYDLPDAGDEYRVGITSPHVQQFFWNCIEVRLAPHVHWEISASVDLRTAGYKRVEPTEQCFSRLEKGSHTVLPDFKVLHVSP